MEKFLTAHFGVDNPNHHNNNNAAIFRLGPRRPIASSDTSVALFVST